MMKDDEVLRDAVGFHRFGCEAVGPRQTPFVGVRHAARRVPIHRKVNEPIWTKPDWAFVEAGEDLPKGMTKESRKGSWATTRWNLGTDT